MRAHLRRAVVTSALALTLLPPGVATRRTHAAPTLKSPAPGVALRPAPAESARTWSPPGGTTRPVPARAALTSSPHGLTMQRASAGLRRVAPPPASATAGTPGALGAAIDRILADPMLAGAQAGVVVADARTGAVLVDRAGQRRLLPASNVKLLTSAAAMGILGPGFRFVTEVRADGVRKGRVLDGDLYLRGSGDPALTPAGLDALARDVADTGVRTVAGDLVGDDTAFDAQRLGLEWAWDDESFAGAAPVSALTVAPGADYLAGTMTVTVAPAAVAGRRPRVTVVPVVGRPAVLVRALTAGHTSAIEVKRRHGSDKLMVTGHLPAGSEPVVRTVTVRNPTAVAVEAFRVALRRHGVRVRGQAVASAPTPATATVVARHTGAPLREMLAPLLKQSNNNMAELLVKAIGRHAAGAGSWPAGTAAVAAYLSRLGIDPMTYRQVDGSGLSRRNLVSPAVVTRVLVAVRREPWFPVWRRALPVAGDPDPMIGGTLRNRMRGTPAAGVVLAKTGTLTGAAALSGYVTTEDLAFSIIVNNHLVPSVTTVLDRIAIVLAGGSGTAAPSPRTAPSTPPGFECSWVRPSAC